MSFIIFPLTLVYITVGMNEPTSTIGPVVKPVSFVQWIIFPYLFSFSIPHATTKLANVSNSVAHIDGPLWYELCLGIIVKLKGSQSDGNLFGAVIVEIFRF